MPDSLLSGTQLDDLADLAASSPPGALVECGVYHGGSALRLYAVAEAQGRTLHLFDTFAGHATTGRYAPDPERDDLTAHPPGRFHEAGGFLPGLRDLMPRAVFHVGIFPDTLPDDLYRVAFVHSDLDLYWPTQAVVTRLPPRMVRGGRLLFDDYPYADSGCPGVKAAVDAVFGPPSPADIRPGGQRLVVVR